MSHFDTITAAPAGFAVTASTADTPVAALRGPGAADLRRAVPPRGGPHRRAARSCSKRFLYDVCGCRPTWTMTSIIEASVDGDPGPGRRRAGHLRPVGRRRLGGGRRARAQGDRRPADLRVRRHRPDARRARPSRSVETFRRHQGIELIHVDAADRFFERLDGRRSTRRRSARSSASCSSASSRTAAAASTDARFLVQGTLYPDVIESGTSARGQDQEPPQRRRPARGHGASSWSSRSATCSRTRSARSATELGLPEEIVWRQPFPGPGLGVRIIGEVTPEKVAILQARRRHRPRGDPRGRPRPRALAGLRRAARHPRRSA